MKLIEIKQGGDSAQRKALRARIGAGAGASSGGAPDPAAIHQIPEQVGALLDRMNIAQLMPRPGEDGPPVEVLVDPQCVERAEVMVQAIGEGAAPEPAATLVAQQRQELAVHGALLGVQDAAETLTEELGDTERAAAEAEQACVREFFARLDELLDGSELDEADRRQLRAAAAAPLRLRDEAAALRGGEAALTRAATAEAQATLGAAAAEGHMKKTALDLIEDRPVSQEDLAAALDTFRALEGTVQ